METITLYDLELAFVSAIDKEVNQAMKIENVKAGDMSPAQMIRYNKLINEIAVLMTEVIEQNKD